ncbi:MAG TPA: sigma factor [Chryseosolibacter sp.]
MPAFPFDNGRFRKLLRSYPAKAVEILYDAFYKKLVTLAFHFTQDLYASEDIVQETLIQVWEKHIVLSEDHHRSIENTLSALYAINQSRITTTHSRGSKSWKSTSAGFPSLMNPGPRKSSKKKI